MKTKLLTAVVALVAAILLLPGVSYALTDEQKVLVGLKGVFVEGGIDNPKGSGLTKDQIKTDVELQLRKAGIKVLTNEERLTTPGQPYLSVLVSIIEISSRGYPIGYAYTITVQLYEAVTIVRGFEAVGSIWSAGWMGYFGKPDRHIRNNISDMVDKFINDYLAANPKK
jgi:hypothetical protein